MKNKKNLLLFQHWYDSNNKQIFGWYLSPIFVPILVNFCYFKCDFLDLFYILRSTISNVLKTKRSNRYDECLLQQIQKMNFKFQTLDWFDQVFNLKTIISQINYNSWFTYITYKSWILQNETFKRYLLKITKMFEI